MKKLFLIIAGLSAFLAQAQDLRPLESIPVQEGGRKKPFLTYSQESLQKLAGRATWKKSDTERMTAMEVVMGLLFNPDGDWENAKLIRCSYVPLKQRLNLPTEQVMFSLKDLSANRELLNIVEDMRKRRAHVTARPLFERC